MCRCAARRWCIIVCIKMSRRRASPASANANRQRVVANRSNRKRSTQPEPPPPPGRVFGVEGGAWKAKQCEEMLGSGSTSRGAYVCPEGKRGCCRHPAYSKQDRCMMKPERGAWRPEGWEATRRHVQEVNNGRTNGPNGKCAKR